MALGDTGITPLQHTGAYATFANGGRLAKPYAILEMFNSKGDLIFGMGENLGAPYTLVGADGVKFTGHGDGGHVFHCAADGKKLWQFQTGSGVNAMPVAYTHNGRQYVTVLSGIGGLWWNAAREQLKNVPPGGSVWTFAVMPD